MATELRADWPDALRAAAHAIRTAPAADLDPVHVGVELVRHAAASAETDGLDSALRWMTIDETVAAIADDLTRLDPSAPRSAVALPATPFAATPQSCTDLRDLCVAIYSGIHGYMTHTMDGRAAVCAATL